MPDTVESRSARQPGDTDMRSTYVAVLAFEVAVLLALWSFSAYFS